MGVAVRWMVAIVMSVAAFALAWWACSVFMHLDEGISLGIAAAVIAIIMTITAWWAGRERPGSESGGGSGGGGGGNSGSGPGGGSGSGWTVNQTVKARGTAYVAGRDINLPPPGNG